MTTKEQAMRQIAKADEVCARAVGDAFRELVALDIYPMAATAMLCGAMTGLVTELKNYTVSRLEDEMTKFSFEVIYETARTMSTRIGQRTTEALIADEQADLEKNGS